MTSQWGHPSPHSLEVSPGLCPLDVIRKTSKVSLLLGHDSLSQTKLPRKRGKKSAWMFGSHQESLSTTKSQGQRRAQTEARTETGTLLGKDTQHFPATLSAGPYPERRWLPLSLPHPLRDPTSDLTFPSEM